MYCFNFTVSSCCDTTKSTQNACGQALMNAVKPSMSAAGFDCTSLKFENTIWQFHACKNGATYRVVGQVSGGDSPSSGADFHLSPTQHC